MKRILIVFLLFSASIFIFSFTVLGQTLYKQKISFSNQALSQPLTGTFTNDSDFSNETTTLLFELKHDINPHLIWSRFETKYGEITNENVDVAIEYYRYEIQNYFHEVKIKPQEVYALLMATSSNLNFTSTDDNTFNGYIGNKSGAGILQIKNLLDHSENTTSMILSQSDSFKEEFVDINPFTGSNKTISVTAFWLAKTENNQTNLNHYRLKIYHNDDLIGVSDSIINNFQLVLGNISSGGTLRIKIERIGSFNGVHNDHIGIAWALTDGGE